MISFNAYLPIGLVMPALALLTVLFIWLEWRRKQSLRMVRIVVVCLMMLALTGIFLRPGYTIEKSSSIILLTHNYDQKKTDSLLRLYRSSTLKHIEGVKSYKGSESLSYSDLSAIPDDIQFVVGEGLPIYALELFERNHFQYIPPDKKEGITQLNMDESIIANRSNIVGGLYYNESGKTRIVLKGPAGKEDSISIEKKGDQPFHLSFIPKQSGNVLYELVVKKIDGTMSREILPLHIEESKPLHILFLQSYPTFETQYLKNFLTAKGHQLVLRYQLSKNNFRFEYGNLPSQQFSRITSELLDHFDLVLLDATELQSLSSAEKTALHENVQNGLGLLLWNVDPSKETKSKINFFPFQTKKIKADTTNIFLSKASITLSAIPYRIEKTASVKPVHENRSGILSGYKNIGLGKIGFQTLQNTYQLTLAGDSMNYSNLWSPIIESISRLDISTSKIKIKTTFPIYQDEPIDIEIISSLENPILTTDSTPMPLQEDVILDDVWHARVWAAEPGWHTLQIKENTSDYYYVSKNEEWKSVSLNQQMQANQLFGRISQSKNLEVVMEFKVIDPIYFYLLFIFAAGFIWLAPKF